MGIFMSRMRLYGASCTLTAGSQEGGGGGAGGGEGGLMEAARPAQGRRQASEQPSLAIATVRHSAFRPHAPAASAVSEGLTVGRAHKAQAERADPGAHGRQPDLHPQLAL